MDNNFLEEIDAEIKKDEMQDLWQEWKRPIIFFFVSVVILTYSVSLWKKNVYKKNLKASYDIEQALTSPLNKNSIVETLESLNKNHNGAYSQMTAFSLAKKTKSLDPIKNIIEKSGDKTLKNLARYIFVLNSIETETTDSLKKYLSPILKKENAWYYHGLELEALLSIKDGKNDYAKANFQKIIASEKAPESIKERSKKMLSVISVENK